MKCTQGSEANMNYYLSSYKLGNPPEKFADLFSQNKSVAYIPNALDFKGADPNRVRTHIASDMSDLEKIGLDATVLDLKDYFDKPPEELENLLNSLAGLWISGGNVFVLRQAMMLSGLDKIILEKNKDEDFVYGGYSAGCCVLSESLLSYQIASDPKETPYSGLDSTIWAGLGLIDFAFMPHYQSSHSESDQIDEEIEYCKSNNISYKPVKDGDVLIF